MALLRGYFIMFMLKNTRIAGPAFWRGTRIQTFRRNLLLPSSENRNLDTTMHLARKSEIELMCLNAMYTVHVVAARAIFQKVGEPVLNSLKPSSYYENI
jgi:hypothetical protein